MLDVIDMYNHHGFEETKKHVETLSKIEVKFIYSTQVVGLLSSWTIRKELDKIFIPLISVKANELKKQQKEGLLKWLGA